MHNIILLDIARWTAYTDAIFVFPSMIIVCTDSILFFFFYQSFPYFNSRSISGFGSILA